MSVKVQSYSLELKAQAVRMAMEDGLGIKETDIAPPRFFQNLSSFRKCSWLLEQNCPLLTTYLKS